VQSPSSLIFLVLLGVWAAYFVQYWVRRRDHVATARSVEQFSEAMRVLERRDPLPRTDLSEPAPRSYAVHPARSARPQVLVKRAVASEPGFIGVTERIGDGSDAVAPVAASAQAAPTPTASPSASPSPGAAPSRPVRPARQPAAAGPARRRVRPSRRVRGLLLLAAIVELLVIAPLVATALLPLWALAPAVLAVGAAFLFVRSGVRAEQAMVRAHHRRQADLRRRRASAPVAPRAGAARSAGSTASTGSATGEVLGGEAVEATEVATVTETAVAAQAEQTVAEPAVAELVVPAEPADDVMVPIVDDDDIPLTWDPVPVPRPTYTMKAKAERPEVAPAAVTPDPAPVVRESASQESYDERRVAGA
jgi:hypothetical protein